MKRQLLLAASYFVCASLLSSAHADVQNIKKQINQLRANGANCGGEQLSAVAPLHLHGKLSAAARRWAQHMADTGQVGHTLNGSSAAQRVAAICGKVHSGEIIARAGLAKQAMLGWKRSTNHCRIMMEPNFTFFGIGKVQGGPYGAIWVVKFASNC